MVRGSRQASTAVEQIRNFASPSHSSSGTSVRSFVRGPDSNISVAKWSVLAELRLVRVKYFVPMATSLS